MSYSLTKNEMRFIAKEYILGLAGYEKYFMDTKVVSSFLEFLETLDFESIMLFYPKEDEIDLLKAFSFLEKRKKNIYLPIIEGEDIVIGLYEKNSIKLGKFGVYEPVYRVERVLSIDVIVVPARAISYDFVRLGRGKGYYDRFLSKFEVGLRVSLIYDYLFGWDFENSSHDSFVDVIITEKDIYYRV